MAAAPQSARAHEGMTLIEALIAIAILSVVMTLVYSSFSQTWKVKERTELRSDHNHYVEAALQRMVDDLSMAYLSAHVNADDPIHNAETAFVGKDRGDQDRVDFVSFSHRRLYQGAKESDQQEVSYFIGRSPDNSNQRVLARREQARVDDDPQHGGAVYVVLEDVIALNLEYLDPLSMEWQREWDSTQAAGQPARLPSQVKISIETPDPLNAKRTIRYATRARVRVPYALNHAVYSP